MTHRTWLIAAVIAAIANACAQPSRSGGTPHVLRTFTPSDAPITVSGVTTADGGWRIRRDTSGSVPLFEVPVAVESSVLTYQARLAARDVRGKVFLEMWVRVPGRGEFFSRGLDQPLHGTSDWASYEIPFFLDQPGVRAELVKLNVAFDGAGEVWIKDVALRATPLG